MKLFLLLFAAAAAVPVRAADKPLFLTGGPKAEDALRRFVERDPRLKVKLDEASRREEVLLARDREPDLRDSVSDLNGPDQLKQRLAQASATDRAALLRQLPGLKAPDAPSCRALTECSNPALSLEVADAELLPDAVRRLVRPWMLLQQARGSEVELTPASGTGDAALNVALKGVASAPLTLNVTANRPGSFTVWFDRPQELAALYVRERDAALKASH
jgi:hypothetical protein